jgi:hypothetical protein
LLFAAAGEARVAAERKSSPAGRNCELSTAKRSRSRPFFEATAARAIDRVLTVDPCIAASESVHDRSGGFAKLVRDGKSDPTG